eukprot:TRINITY_DN4511_c0_g2_i1.p1 TRINITY_DN4511_c0_g2~~TRINITY_DN4511_c0_g2_i1.p1  ORF type:complete len:394 (-),score=86.41 TRINITY_DN4511_c0_g2_i1:105-1133(-)
MCIRDRRRVHGKQPKNKKQTSERSHLTMNPASMPRAPLSKSLKESIKRDQGIQDERSSPSRAREREETELNHDPHQHKDFNAREYLIPGTRERDIYIYKQLFDIMDRNQQELLIPMDLRSAFVALGYNAKRQTIYQMFSDLDQDESGGIDFPEFVKLMVNAACDADTDDGIRKMYQQYDVHRKGHITIEDFQNVMKEMDEELTDEQIKEIFTKIDPNGGGVNISESAFMKFNKKKEFAQYGAQEQGFCQFCCSCISLYLEKTRVHEAWSSSGLVLCPPFWLLTSKVYTIHVLLPPYEKLRHLTNKACNFTNNHVLRIWIQSCLLYTSPSPRDGLLSRMPSSA